MDYKSRVAYFCLTPYQVINAIVLSKTNLNEVADLYLNIRLKNVKQIKKILQKLNIFNKITIINEEIYWNINNNFIHNTFIKIFNYIRARKIVKSVVGNTTYNKIYLYAKNRLGTLIYLYISKKDYCELVYYEDGLGSYCNKYLYTLRYRDYLLRKLLFNASNDLNKIPLYVYSPELYRNIGIMPFSDIKKIPTLFSNIEFKPLLNKIFNYKQEYEIKENILIIDITKESVLDNENLTKARFIYNLINEELSFAGVILKKHPRAIKDSNVKIKEYEQKDIPFELICMNNDISKKVLISIASSAVLTPKILFNQEPYIILLHNLFSFKDNYICQGYKNIDFVYHKCKEMYKSSSKFFIPNSIDELKECINIIKNNYKKI